MEPRIGPWHHRHQRHWDHRSSPPVTTRSDYRTPPRSAKRYNFWTAPSLAHAADRTAPNLSGLIALAATGDAIDLLNVKDTGRALALLATTPELQYLTYNIASGHATSNGDVIDAIKSVESGFHFEFPEGDAHPQSWLDTTRLRTDTGFGPKCDTAATVADYIAWLRAGNKR